MSDHKWHLVGPWYRWGSAEEDPGRERSSRPVIQKYPDSDLVDSFLENPQHSLKYLAEDRTGNNRRKIFLDTHSRFYLVSCGLHCDAPGFPKVARDKVCEAGIVIRKRKTDVPEALRPQVDRLLHTIAYEKARLKRIDSKKKKYSGSVGAMAVTRSLKTAMNLSSKSVSQKVTQKYMNAHNELKKLLSEFGISQSVQAWRVTGSGSGAWENIEDETPQQINEQVFPLYPLITDQADVSHPSGHMTIWYGLLPVGTSDTDAFSNPRFDDRSVYEVRCFVRRHKKHCPKKSERNDCHGELVWSRPTETYRLAAHFDLRGTSNRMTTIQAPNLNDLKYQIEKPDFKLGQGMGLAVATPAGSGLPINLDDDNNPQEGSPSELPSICFFAIPLITIVALFLLRLFLPIVVFLFGLWFLLSLKLCILPSLDIDFDLTFDVDVEGKLGVEIEAELSAKLETNGAVVTALLALFEPGMKKKFEGQLADVANHPDVYRDMARIAVQQTADFSDSGVAQPLVDEIRSIISDNPALAQKTSGAGQLADSADRLAYYDTVKLAEVIG